MAVTATRSSPAVGQEAGSGRPADRPRGTVCLVTQWFHPEPVHNPLWLAQGLAERGWAVRVLTGVPNYPDGVVRPGYRASRFSREQVDGLPVRRTPLVASHDSSAGKRILTYASWALSSAVGGLGELRRSDVALVYSSPATAALPAMLARVVCRTPFVLLVQDVWPDSVFAAGFLKRGIVARLAGAVLTRFTRAAYRLAARVVVISPGMLDLLSSRGVPREKLDLVYNWVDESAHRPAEADPGLRAHLGIPPEDFVVMYAGNVGPAQDLDNVVKAMALLGAADGVHLVVVGDGLAKASLQESARALTPGNVHFLPPRPVAEMAAVSAAADMQLVSLRDEDLFRVTLPSKVQAILAAGQPLLVCGAGDAADVVVAAQAGLACAPGNPEALATCLREAARSRPEQRERYGANARRHYERHMSRATGAARLSDVLAQVLTQSTPRREAP